MKTIKSKRDFESVFSRGKRINNSLLRLRVARREEGETGKIALVAPKRLGHAVHRNKCKHILVAAALKRMLVKAGI